MSEKPTLRVAVLADYVCPFCYIGYLRLEKLRRYYELAVNWVLVEIHPDSPADGRHVEDPDYDGQALPGELGDMARAEGFAFYPHLYITNTHKALLLAEAAKPLGAETFYRLHSGLFDAFMREGRNIGDVAVLEGIAEQCGIPGETLNQAWHDPALDERLQRNAAAAVKFGTTRTPTVFIGERVLSGVVSDAELLDAARAAVPETRLNPSTDQTTGAG